MLDYLFFFAAAAAAAALAAFLLSRLFFGVLYQARAIRSYTGFIPEPFAFGFGFGLGFGIGFGFTVLLTSAYGLGEYDVDAGLSGTNIDPTYLPPPEVVFAGLSFTNIEPT